MTGGDHVPATIQQGAFMVKAYHMTTLVNFYASRDNGFLRPRSELAYYADLQATGEFAGLFGIPGGTREAIDYKNVFFSPNKPILPNSQFGYIYDAEYLIYELDASVRLHTTKNNLAQRLYFLLLPKEIKTVLDPMTLDLDTFNADRYIAFLNRVPYYEIDPKLILTQCGGADRLMRMWWLYLQLHDMYEAIHRYIGDGVMKHELLEHIHPKLLLESEKAADKILDKLKIDGSPKQIVKGDQAYHICSTYINPAEYIEIIEINEFQDILSIYFSAFIGTPERKLNTLCEIMVPQPVPTRAAIGIIEKGVVTDL